MAIVPTGLQYFFCIGSKHNPQEFLTSRFPFFKARCGYIAVGNLDPHRAAVLPMRVGIRDKLLSNFADHLSANYLWMMFCRLSSVGCLLFVVLLLFILLNCMCFGRSGGMENLNCRPPKIHCFFGSHF